MGKLPRILIFDLEVSTLRLEVETYGLKIFSQYHRHQDITRDYAIQGAAWKWLEDENTYCISVSPKNPFHDEFVVRKMLELISQADILVGHNMARFDLRKFNARALYYGLSPIHKIQIVDTLKLARKHFHLSSNSLAYIAKYLQLDIEKDTSPDWEAIRAGDSDALAYMRKYNKRDVDVTEKVYLKLRSWDHNPPSVAVIQEVKDIEGLPVLCCRACGSAEVVKNGLYYGPARKKQKYRCKKCKHSFPGK